MSPQQTIAHYRITAKLGEGGMGEVWRAIDTKLNREVAIKILPEAFANDPDRMARFQREAQVLASLNHPNIAAIYGVEERAIVMELVEGEDPHGPLPLEEAVPIARQIADALEAAHEKGIVHRDLKPANIKVKSDRTVKVLDFGLAKSAEFASGDAHSSPTLTMRATVAGVILGTAGYMSPEQAAGKPVDKRADIWSFGVVLWELLTGRQLFAGETVSHTLADVLRAPLDLEQLPAGTPPAIRQLIARCLERDVRKRLRDIGEARLVLEGPPAAAPVDARIGDSRQPRLAWGIAAAFFVAASALAVIHFRETPTEVPLLRAAIPPPEHTTFAFTGGLAVAGPVELSPDGRRMVFSAEGDHKRQLYVRPLDAPTAQPLPGTDEAIHPFWAPDSRFIGFFAGGKLKKIDAFGGPPVPLCDALNGRGGTWNQDGVILFSPSGIIQGFLRVSASGGVPTEVPLDSIARWPWFLPDGRHFLFAAPNAVRLGSLDSKQTRVVVETASDAAYAQGHLVYLRDDVLMAQAFDLKRLSLAGEPVPIAQDVRSVGIQRRGVFSVSQNGMLAYQSGGGGTRFQLTWFDRGGKRLGTLGEPAILWGVFFSPDRKSVATAVVDPGTHTSDLWIFDAARGTRTRLTFAGVGSQPLAVWSPDGTAIVFDSGTDGKFGLYRKAANLTGKEEQLYADDAPLIPTSWSPDGKTLLFLRPRANGAIFGLPLEGERKPFPVVQTTVAPMFAQFSPDGRWIAYQSAESGRVEIYAAPFPGPGGKVQISSAGGVEPHWRTDGKELFYLAPDGHVVAVEVKASGGALQVGSAQPLFGGVASLGALAEVFDVTADGQRFLVQMPLEQATPEPVTLVQNWTALLKK